MHITVAAAEVAEGATNINMLYERGMALVITKSPDCLALPHFSGRPSSAPNEINIKTGWGTCFAFYQAMYGMHA